MRHKHLIYLTIYELFMLIPLYLSIIYMAPERCISSSPVETFSRMVPLIVILFMLAPGFSILHDP